MRILLVEDDDVLRSLLTQRLQTENYAVDAVSDGQQGWNYLSTYDYDLLILDVILPGIDGVTLCKTLRTQEYILPILLLTAQDTRDAKRMGWEAGADDYVVKPFDEEELVARIRALLRRSSMNPLPTLTWGPLWLDTNTCEVSYNGEELSLTAKEYTLLEMMLRDSQHVFSNEDIIEGLWASEEFPTDATVRSHIRRLRRKLSAVGAPTDLIATSHGRGYYLKPLEDGDNTISPKESELVSGNIQANILPTLASTLDRERPDADERGDAEKITMNPTDSTHQELTEQAINKQISRAQGSHPQKNDVPKLVRREAEQPCANSLNSMASASSPNTSNAVVPQDDRQRRYAEALKQAWEQHKDGCLQKVDELEGAIAQLESNALSHSTQATAYRLAHTLSGTLGTFGLLDIMKLARQIEQAVHPDLYFEPMQAKLLQHQVTALKQAIQTVQMGSSSRPASLPVQEPTRLMLVDDDPIFLKTMLGQLQGYGFEVSVLDDPQQFWVALDTVAPEVLILDVQMPHCNGLELCQTLRLAPEWQKLPVMFLSILGDAETQHQAFAVGADDYLAKPITAQHLSNRIRQRLQRIQAFSHS